MLVWGHDICLFVPDPAKMPPPGVCLNILEARNKQNNHGSSQKPKKFLQQDYEQLKEYCNIRGLRYIDEKFPPDRNSIGAGILTPSDLDRVVWLRPTVSSAASSVSPDWASVQLHHHLCCLHLTFNNCCFDFTSFLRFILFFRLPIMPCVYGPYC